MLPKNNLIGSHIHSKNKKKKKKLTDHKSVIPTIFNQHNVLVSSSQKRWSGQPARPRPQAPPPPPPPYLPRFFFTFSLLTSIFSFFFNIFASQLLLWQLSPCFLILLKWILLLPVYYCLWKLSWGGGGGHKEEEEAIPCLDLMAFIILVLCYIWICS